MSLALSTRANVTGVPARSILKITRLDEFLSERRDPEDCALWLDDSEELRRSRAAIDLTWGAIITPRGEIQLPPTTLASCSVNNVREPLVIAPGDVIRVNARQGLVSVLYRRRSRTNSLLVTERCNSYCVMCSQPPIDRDNDASRVDELLRIVRLVDTSEAVLGVTGGEPTLLGPRFVELIRGCRAALPNTGLHVLTNGRTFANRDFAVECARAGNDSVVWGIPLYTEVPEIHDFVVQRRGAFIETMHGLLHLAQLEQKIELRIVLQRATVPQLVSFAEFICRNLNFVDHVAWMGLEPMGFARPNWNSIWIDPGEYGEALETAISILERADIATSIFNLPLCTLPESIRPFAAQSISDWKNDFGNKCSECAVRARCCGFFSSAGDGFMPGTIAPIKASTAKFSTRGEAVV